MSAKGRGEDIGGDHEVFPSPGWTVHRLLDRAAGTILRPGLWLEPCAGYGAIVRAAATHPVTAGRLLWSACEIRREVAALLTHSLAMTGSPAPVIGDFLTSDLDRLRECTAVVTNPPFELAFAFLMKCLAFAPLAHVAFLLRTNFISGAEDRYPWLRDHMPDEYRLPNRPIFRGDHADSAEYSWFIWMPGAGSFIRRRGAVEMLDETPIDVRKRDLAEARSLLEGVEFLDHQTDLFGGAA